MHRLMVPIALSLLFGGFGRPVRGDKVAERVPVNPTIFHNHLSILGHGTQKAGGGMNLLF